MSAMSASPPVKPVGAPLMPLSLIAEHKVPTPVPPAMPREKITPTKQPQPQAQPTANGMEAALPLVQQAPGGQQPDPVAAAQPPALHNSSAAPAVAQQAEQQHAAAHPPPPQPQPQPTQDVAKTEPALPTSGGTESAKPAPATNNIQPEVNIGDESPGQVEEPEAGATTSAAAPTPALPSVPAAQPPTAPLSAPPEQPAMPASKPSDIKVATLPQPRPAKRKPIKVVNETKKEKEVENEGSKGGDGRKSKRMRLPTQPYQSPIPELNIIAKISKIEKPQSKVLDEKLIVFYRNEFLAVRNAEGGFYICQAMQNLYKSSARIRIRWLSQQDNDLYTPDFYDTTDFDCILTNLNMEGVEKNKFRLPAEESQRTESILKRAIDLEKGVTNDTAPTEEHPDGLDLSLYRNEEQLKKRKSKSRPKSPRKSGTKSKRRAAKKSSDSSGQDNTPSSSSSASSSEVRKTKKRGSLTSSRAAKKRKVVAKKVGGGGGIAASGKKALATAGPSKREATKRETKVAAGSKRKAAVVVAAGSQPEKRARRAPPQETSTKTRSVVAGSGGGGGKLRERRARK